LRTQKRNRHSRASSAPDRSGRGAAASEPASNETNEKPVLRLLAPILVVALLLAGASLFAQTTEDGAPPTGSLPRTAFPHFNTSRLIWDLVVVLLLILVTAFFALAEYALITVRKTRIRQLVEEGNRAAILVERMLEHPTRMMATIQTGITLVATVSSAFAATSAVAPLSAWLQTHGLTEGAATFFAFLLVVVPVTILSLVIGEIAPKSLAVQNSERFALVVVYPISWLQWLLAPGVWLLTHLSNLVVRPFGGTASFTTPAVNEEELKLMVEASEEQGVLQAEETEMIHSILDFGDTVVRKVMTPRIDMTAVNIAEPMETIVRHIAESGHTRIPVYESDLDNIVGVVHAKDVLTLLVERPSAMTSISEIVRPAYFIPETKKVDELLAELRRSKQQIAIVRDEYGVTAGLVTIEDLIEEIVGEIQDEYDVDEPTIQVIDAHISILDGRMSLSDVNDRMGLELPEDEADTIGGFVFGLLGHQAEQGERVFWEGIEFVVEATDGRRVTKVRLIRHTEPEDGSDVPPQVEQPATPSAPAPAQNGTGRRPTVETSGVETAPPRLL